MSTMKDLARVVADKQGITRAESEQFVVAMFELLRSALNTDDQVKVKGLGTFKIQTVKSRSSINVNTGERVVIDSHDKITFTPDKAMAESVNKPFGHFETVVLNDGVVFDDMEEASGSSSDVHVEVPVQGDVAVVSELQPVTQDIGTEQENIQMPAPLERAETACEQVEDAPSVIPAATPAVAQESQSAENLSAVQAPRADIDVPKESLPAEDSFPAEDAGLIEEKSNRMMYMLFGILLVVFFTAGFFTGRMTMDDITAANAETPVKKVAIKRVVKVVSKPAAQKNIDTVKTELPEVSRAEQQHAERPVKEKEEQSAVSYDSDPRIRTGAYRITGIDRTVTVSKGQTLEAISKTYLGPGMECYVEAVNGGIKEVRAGQKINIPSLKVKRKKKV